MNQLICLYLCLGLLLSCQTTDSEASNTSISNSNSATELDKTSSKSSKETIAQSQNNLTYINEKLGFSFSYSEDYQIEEIENSLTIWRNQDYQNREDFIEATPLSISIVNNSQNLSLIEWVEESSYLIQGDVTTLSIASNEAITFQWVGMWSYQSVIITHNKPNQLIIITLDQDMSEYQNIFEEILATLNFIEH